MLPNSSDTIAIIGLGYVGLPLAIAFAKKYAVIGFDISTQRIQELTKGFDRTREVDKTSLQNALYLSFSSDTTCLAGANIYIITVPTPIDSYKKPNLTPLKKASETVGNYLNKGDIVVYESTVYPGCTEEECLPILALKSGLKFNEDFYIGYSPERINPGDKMHTVGQIKKIVSGSTDLVAHRLNELYASIISAGTYLVSAIRVAEAAKVIENAQRDLNIAFMNELSIVFSKMNIDTSEVLAAAATKWNFLHFRPGLVGGHCIGVDPYYLTYKAESLGYQPEVILSGRRINNNIGGYIGGRLIKLIARKGHCIKDAHILILGITFKENCPDIRNSRVIDVIEELKSYGAKVSVYDPYADGDEVIQTYGFALAKILSNNYTAVVLAVAHHDFKNILPRDLCIADGVVFDVKSFYEKSLVDDRL